MYCWKCGCANNDDYDTCRRCGLPRRPEGESPPIADDLAEAGGGSTHVLGERYEVSEETTSSGRVPLDSTDDLPPEIRERIEAIRAELPPGAASGTFYHVTDSAGQDQTYQSLDEMPPDVRASFEHLRQQADRPGTRRVRIVRRGPTGPGGLSSLALKCWWVVLVLLVAALVGWLCARP